MLNLGGKGILALFALWLTVIGGNLFGQCSIGESELVIAVTAGGFANEISWELVDATANVVVGRNCGAYDGFSPGNSTYDTLCVADGTSYTFSAYDDWGDGWNSGIFSIIVDGATLLTSSPNNGSVGDGTDDCIGQDLEESYTFDPGSPVMGCTDTASLNYNPFASIDDGSCQYPSGNDACENAFEIALNSCFSGELYAATFNPADSLNIDPACSGLIGGEAKDIWFKVLIPASGSMEISLPQVPGISSTLQFLYGGCDSLAAVPASSCQNYAAGGATLLTGLTAGEFLYIRYFDYASNDEGAYELCIDEPPVGCTDPCAANYDPSASIDDGSCTGYPTAGNVLCDSATLLPGPGAYNFYSVGGHGTDITSCTPDDSVAIWFAYDVPLFLDTFRVFTCGSSFDTGLSIWDSCGGIELACNNDGTPGGGDNCDGSDFQSMIELVDTLLDELEGSRIYIRLSGANGTSGCGEIKIREIDGSTCSAAMSVTNLVATLDSTKLKLNWDTIPSSVGCLLSYGPAGGSFIGTRKEFGFELTSVTVPRAAIPAGTWMIKVRCACQISPSIIATGFSNVETFSVPAPRNSSNEFLSQTFELWPNPVQSTLYAQLPPGLDDEGRIRIVDMLGKVHFSDKFNGGAQGNILELKVDQLPPGGYIIQIETAQTTHYQRFKR